MSWPISLEICLQAYPADPNVSDVYCVWKDGIAWISEDIFPKWLSCTPISLTHYPEFSICPIIQQIFGGLTLLSFSPLEQPQLGTWK